jgi:hypothetical protein
MVNEAAEAVVGATKAWRELGGAIANPESMWLGAALVAVRWHAHLGAMRDHKTVRYAAYRAEQAMHSLLVEDIFGNPFRPAAVDPSWLTSTVVALARGIYEERAFDRMPILADALQDAGCDNDDVLNHCRGPGPHVRGCWVVDLVLGKA